MIFVTLVDTDVPDGYGAFGSSMPVVKFDSIREISDNVEYNLLPLELAVSSNEFQFTR